MYPPLGLLDEQDRSDSNTIQVFVAMNCHCSHMAMGLETMINIDELSSCHKADCCCLHHQLCSTSYFFLKFCGMHFFKLAPLMNTSPLSLMNLCKYS